VRWERLLALSGLIAAFTILSSCGSSSTAVTPSITASCVSTGGTGADVTVLGTAQCTASVLNVSSTLVNWSVSGTGNGSIDTTSGLYTAPATVPTNNVVTITATSQSQSSLSTTTSVTIEAATAITAVICNDASGNQPSTVSSGNQLSCTAYASVSTGTTVSVNWTLANANDPNSTTNLGTITKQGIYTAPLVPPPGQKVTITATSKSLATETMSVPVSVVFGNQILSGSYVFSTSGRVPNTSKAFWARAGYFTAGGGALSGLEDTNQGGSPNIVDNATNGAPLPRSFTGSYIIGPDGRGTMQFCEDTNAPCPQGGPASSYFRLVVVSPSQAEIVEFSSPNVTSANTTAGGEILSQDPLVSPNSQNLSGTYSFNFAGVSTTSTEESALGEFVSNGFGAISLGTSGTPGEMDINPTPSSSPTTIAAANYSISSNGRGTVTLNGLNFSFYPISASRAKFIEIDTAASGTPTTPASMLVGDAYKQQTQGLTCGWGVSALSGPVVLETSGMDTTGGLPGVRIGTLGSFTAAGSTGTFSGASLDENDAGTVPPPQLGTLSGNYSVGVPCGRGTLAVGSHTYVFYLISTSYAVLEETTTGIIAHGFLIQSQSGPFVDSTLTGSYALGMAGTDAAGTSGNREDFLGQFTSAGSGAGISGAVDLNDFGVTQTGISIANGTYPPPSGGIRETLVLPLGTTPASTRNLVLYMVSPTLFYALSTDSTGTANGAIYNQF
jgi:hypothetical protein